MNMRFECQPGCTACCDKPGFVYITEKDSQRISAFLGMTLEDFEARHVYRTPKMRRLRVPRESQCSFLGDGGCSIHSVKPVQCRAFPFWPEIMGDEKEWFKAGSSCPGIGKGELIQIEVANACVEEMRAAYPTMYR